MLGPVGIAALVAIFAWWFSTGAILVLVRLADRLGGRAHLRATLLCLPFLAGGWWALIAGSGGTSVAHVYAGFLGALAVWGWFELAFLTGIITGPHMRPCPPNVPEWERFIRAWGTIAYSEIALLGSLLLLGVLVWNEPNSFGLWTFAVLFFARISAKLNVYLGVPNINFEFLPAPMRHLGSHFRVAPMNALFPVAITVMTLATGCFIERVIALEGAHEIGFTLLAALTALAALEHWAMVLPLQDAKLWRWMLALMETTGRQDAPTTRTRPSEDRHGF
ncbi:putative photosynthetic complex assembly protein PuhE [Pontivivens insulae]|uniref:Photosynthetic complex assembly protein 2 n=1 Tax=Pontivivens insulae TaxID=1639689 RepID=A0A2R8AAE7_9RHOB|nr:putative photosynthetic complex assembly protein PuhE [Pontivivens insulae]RED12937.1 putative photosynthetic complex assembly protein 2 [Pontivivens insulae]SPF29030.1 hypothetical protein POI8812_01335 [Pontivivens insulae]